MRRYKVARLDEAQRRGQVKRLNRIHRQVERWAKEILYGKGESTPKGILGKSPTSSPENKRQRAD